VKKEILKLGLALAIYAGIACAALALVYAVTAPTIAGLEQKQLDESLSDLFPEADSFAPVEGIASSDATVKVNGAWKAVKGDLALGIALKMTGKSYGGDAAMLVAVGVDRLIKGVRILSLKDTPGLGANAQSPTYFVDRSAGTTFPGQFAGKPVSDPFEVKNDVVAITASTITSKALATIVKRAGEAGSAWLESAAAGGK